MVALYWSLATLGQHRLGLSMGCRHRPYTLLSQNGLPPPPLCMTSFLNVPLIISIWKKNCSIHDVIRLFVLFSWPCGPLSCPCLFAWRAQNCFRPSIKSRTSEATWTILPSYAPDRFAERNNFVLFYKRNILSCTVGSLSELYRARRHICLSSA